MGERGVETDDPPYREHGARVSGLGATARPQTDVGGRGPRRDQIGCHPLEGACQVGVALPDAGQRRAVLGEVVFRAHPGVDAAQPDCR